MNKATEEYIRDKRECDERLERSLLEKEQERKEEAERNIMLVVFEAERRILEKIEPDRIDNTSDEIKVLDLAYIVRRLVLEARKHDGDSDLSKGALDYLRRKGLTGLPLRGAKENDAKLQN